MNFPQKGVAGYRQPLCICAPGRAHRLGGESPLLTRQGEELAGRQGCCGQLRIWRKPQAKRWPDEQEADTRRYSGVRRQVSSKPDTCTERCNVNPTGISRKVARITLGGPPACLVLLALRDAGMGWRESAEAILAILTKSQRAEPAKSGKGAMSPLSLDSCPERELATRAVGAGSPEGGRSVYRTAGE